MWFLNELIIIEMVSSETVKRRTVLFILKEEEVGAGGINRYVPRLWGTFPHSRGTMFLRAM